MLELSSEFRLILYDQRGHGLSAFPENADFSIDAMARDLDVVVRAAREPVTLVGHSMGGMAVLRYAGMFPERIGGEVSAIALVDTNCDDVLGGLMPGAARMALPALRLIETAAAASPRRLDGIRRSQRRLIRTGVKLMSFGKDAAPERLSFVEQLFAAVPAAALVRVIATLRTLDVREGMESVDVPTLVMVGSRDRITPIGAARKLAHGIHGSELVTITGAGHMPMLEQPEAFNAVLREFLANPGASYGGRRLGARLPQIAPD
jgi:pimeloyl-ACP methyl ester carboxylesterase